MKGKKLTNIVYQRLKSAIKNHPIYPKIKDNLILEKREWFENGTDVDIGFYVTELPSSFNGSLLRKNRYSMGIEVKHSDVSSSYIEVDKDKVEIKKEDPRRTSVKTGNFNIQYHKNYFEDLTPQLRNYLNRKIANRGKAWARAFSPEEGFDSVLLVSDIQLNGGKDCCSTKIDGKDVKIVYMDKKPLHEILREEIEEKLIV